MRITADRNAIAELASHFKNNLLHPDLRFTMTTNPDMVVVLTAASLYGSVFKRSAAIRSSIVSLDPELGLYNQSCAPLMALAARCVCEPKSEVIAIGYRYQKPNAELIIPPNNGPLTDLTLKHL